MCTTLPVFHLAQVFTGHGAYNEYFHRFSILASTKCAQCGISINDVEHIIFVYPWWNVLQADIAFRLSRTVCTEGVGDVLCGAVERDQGVSSLALPAKGICLDMVENIMTAKELEEKERQHSSRRP